MSGDSDTDTISLTSTVENPYDSSEEFQVEKILAERNEGGRVVYLVKWENYGEFEISWEPVENFVTVGSEHSAISGWIETKKKQEKNLQKPFDVARWERRLKRFRQQKHDRKARRARKREKLGITKDDSEDSDYEELPVVNQDSEFTGTSEGEDDSPADERRTARGSRSKTPRQRGKKPSTAISTENDDSSEDDNDTPLIQERRSKPKSNTRAEPTDDASDASDEQPLMQKRASNAVSSANEAPSKRGSGNKSFLSASSAFSRTPVPSKHADSAKAPSRIAAITGPSTKNTNTSTARNKPTARDPPRSNAESTNQPEQRPTKPTAGVPKKKLPTQIDPSPTAPPFASNTQKKAAPSKPPNIFASNLNKPKDLSASKKKPETQDPGLYKRLSVQHRHQQKALADRAPDINSLHFVDLNNDNAASQPRQVSKVVKSAKQSAADTVTNPDGNAQIAELHPAEEQAGVPAQTHHQLTQPPGATRIENMIQNASEASTLRPTPRINTSESRASVATIPLPKKLPSSRTPLGEERDVASITTLIDDMRSTEVRQLLLGRAQEYSNDDQEPGIDMNMHDSNAETGPTDNPGFRPHQPNLGPGTPTARPEHSQWPQQAHARLTEVPPRVVDAQPPNSDRFDAHPLPLNTLEVLPDARCTPVRAHFVFGQTLLPISLTNLPNSTRFLVLKKVKDGQNVHLHLNALISAVDYKRLLPDNGDVYFGLGPVQARSDASMNQRTADEALKKLQRTLETRWSTAVFFHEAFTLLVYPTGGAEWKHFDDRLKKADNSALRFVLRVPVKSLPNITPRPTLDRGVLAGPTSRSGLRLLLRSVLGIDLRLISEPERLSSTRHFFLMYPEDARRDHDILVSALRRLGYKVRTSFVKGDWQQFVDTVVIKSSAADKEAEATDAGVVLVHWSFTQFRAIPRLMRLLRAKDLLVYKVNERSQPLPGQDSLSEIFPRGGGSAVMLLDSFFIHDPEGVTALLEWYHRSGANPTISKWRLVVRPQIHSWLKEVALSLLTSGMEGDLERAKVWMNLIASVNKLVPPEDMCPIYDYEIADWHENPRLLSFMRYTCPGLCWDHPIRPEDSWANHEQTTKNDEMLFQWFGAWSLEEIGSYRSFIALSGEPDQGVYRRSMDKWPTRWRYIELWPSKEFLRENVKGAKTTSRAGVA